MAGGCDAILVPELEPSLDEGASRDGSGSGGRGFEAA